MDPAGVRAMLGDGNYGGLYQRSDADMLAIWAVAVEETRALIEGPWA
jgi:creatinine amidohydrolase